MTESEKMAEVAWVSAGADDEAATKIPVGTKGRVITVYVLAAENNIDAITDGLNEVLRAAQGDAQGDVVIDWAYQCDAAGRFAATPFVFGATYHEGEAFPERCAPEAEGAAQQPAPDEGAVADADVLWFRAWHKDNDPEEHWDAYYRDFSPRIVAAFRARYGAHSAAAEAVQRLVEAAGAAWAALIHLGQEHGEMAHVVKCLDEALIAYEQKTERKLTGG